jgi:SAM-dependent methyltransferase
MSDRLPPGPAVKLVLWCLHFFARLHPRHRSHRLLYQFFASPFSEGLDELEFLNYGYVPLDGERENLELEDSEEVYRTNIQLYHHLASAVPLQGREVLEIGCGHGGGAAYVMRTFRPSRMEAVDLSEGSIRLCRERHAAEGLAFRTGDALDLPWGNDAFDAVLNVESCHAYPSSEIFFREVHRVLRPGGHLLFADLCPTARIPELRANVDRSGLKVLREEDITANVLRARDEFTRLMAERMRDRMRWFGSFALSWLGATDSLVYKYMKKGRFKYLLCVMQKPEHSMEGIR